MVHQNKPESGCFAGPFRFSDLSFDESNWLFVFAALLQVLGEGGLDGVFVGGGPKRQAGSFSRALWFSPRLFWSGQWFCMWNTPYFHNFKSILVWNCAKTQNALHVLPARALRCKPSMKSTLSTLQTKYISGTLWSLSLRPDILEQVGSLGFS